MTPFESFFQMLTPIFVLIAIFGVIWSVLSLISQRNTAMQGRIERMTRPMASSSSFELPDTNKIARQERMKGMSDAISNFGTSLKPQTEQEQSKMKLLLQNAGFRSEAAVGVYSGIRLGSLVLFLALGLAIFVPRYGLDLNTLKWLGIPLALGFYLPVLGLWYLIGQRKQEIFLSLPDALDLLVVCVESGLGLDAALRRVSEEMKDHAKVLAEELSLCNFQMQMGRPRRDVLHDLGTRTGVDDLRSLAAILIQADRFGSSIALALRVQSDSMRVKRRQIAEEKAAMTAVQMIFPLVLFIFPGIFVVLVGPAAIQISESIMKM